MRKKTDWKQFIVSLVVIWSFIFVDIPVAKAQDLEVSADISGGFVFRSPRQTKSAFRNSSSAKRVTTQKVATKKKVKTQAVAIAKAKPRPKPKPFDPGKLNAALIASNKPKPKPTPKPKPGQKPKPTPTPTGQTDAELSDTFAGGGEVYLERGQIDDAVKLFRKAVEFNKNNEPAKLGLSEALVEKGDSFSESETPETSIAYYEEAIKANDKNSSAYVGLAEVYDDLDQRDKAIFNYEKALQYSPELTELYSPIGILYYQKGDIKNAENYLQKAISTEPNGAETQYFLGLVRFKQNDNSEALKAFLNATKLDPTSSEAFYYLGETYDRLDKDQDSINAYKQATTINPRYTDAWFDLGVALYTRGKDKKDTNYLNEAITAYQKVNQLDNAYNKGAGHAYLGDAYRALGDLARVDSTNQQLQQPSIAQYSKANGEYSIALSQDANNLDLLSRFGYTLGREGKWTRSIEILNQAISIKPNDIDYLNLGWAYLNSGRNDLMMKNEASGKDKLAKAKVNLQKAVSYNSSNDNIVVATNLNLGSVLNDLGEFQAAVDALKIVTSRKNNWYFASNELGNAYFALKDFNNAVEQFKRATDVNDKYAQGFYNLGMSYHALGNKKEAKKALDKLKKLDPNLYKILDFNLGIPFGQVPGVNNVTNKIPNIPKFPY
jgi:superkiller protein 3